MLADRLRRKPARRNGSASSRCDRGWLPSRSRWSRPAPRGLPAAPPISIARRRPAMRIRSGSDRARPASLSGSRPPSAISSARAPMRDSGSSTRFIGRLRKRSVAVEHGRDRTARHRAHDEPAAGAGIAEIERRRRLRKPRHPHALYRPGALAGPLDARAQRPHHFRGIDHVLAFQKTADPGFADGHGRQDQRAMRDRLVARHPHAALQRRRAARGQRRSGQGMAQGGGSGMRRRPPSTILSAPSSGPPGRQPQKRP